MSLIQFACLILATKFFKTSEGQCYGRNAHHGSGSGPNSGFTRAYLPVVLTDPPYPPRDTTPCRNPTVPDQSSTHTVLTDEDLKALLQLAKILESDKTACATKGIDVDRLLETLVTALVYTTAHTVETSANRCNKAAETDANGSLLGQNGLVERLLGIILGGQSTSNGGAVRSVTQGTSTVTTETNTGQGLIGIGLGQDGLNVKVGDLVSANVGGKGSAGTTGTSSGSTVSSTTSTVGGLLGNGDKGLLGGVTGNDGLVGGLLTGNGDKGLLGGVTGNGGVAGGNSDKGLLGGVTGNNGVVGGLLSGNNDKGLLGGVTGNGGVAGGNSDKGLLGGVTGNNGVVGELLEGVGGTLDGVGDTVGGLL